MMCRQGAPDATGNTACDAPLDCETEVAAGKSATSQAGFIIVWASILMLVLVMMAAFVVDLGAWYTRTSKLQQAADAATTAAAQQLHTTASGPYDAAVASLRANGFDPTGNPKLSITICPNALLQYVGPQCAGVSGDQTRVVVTDLKPPQFFSGVVLKNAPKLTRQSTAQFVDIPKASSPYNTFGDGSPKDPANPGDQLRTTGLWAQIAGPCVAAEDGDLISSLWDGNSSRGSSFFCDSKAPGSGVAPGVVANDKRKDPSTTFGYIYKIHVPTAVTTKIQLKDATYWPGIQPNYGRSLAYSGTSYSAPVPYLSTTGFPDDPWNWNASDVIRLIGNGTIRLSNNSGGDVGIAGLVGDNPRGEDYYSPDSEKSYSKGGLNNGYGESEVTTIYQLYKSDKTTLVPGAERAVGGRDPAFTMIQGWTDPNSFFTVNQAGDYYLQVTTSDPGNKSWGTNGFGIRALQSGVETCSAVTSPLTCPTITPEGYFSVFTKIDRKAAVSSTDIPLALVKPSHSGKTFRLSLFDPGEGVESLQILDTLGNPLELTVRGVKIDSSGGEVAGPNIVSGVNKFDVTNVGVGCVALYCSSPNTTWWDVARPNANMGSHDKFNDRLVQIEVTIPAVSADGYFKIRYNVAGIDGSKPLTDPVNLAPNDSTTWKVEIVDNRVAIVR